MYSIGVDLGGTKILTGLVNDTGVIERTVEVPTGASEGPDAVIERIVRSVQEVKGAVPNEHLYGIGIGAPGPLNPKDGVVLSPPNLPGWDNIPLRDRVGQRFGLPCFLENDANAAALAEHRFGAGQGTTDMIYITVSTGIGAGLILDGKLYHGSGGFAGEVGHIVVDTNGPVCTCGNTGCLEAVSSGTAIAREASIVFGRQCTAKEVAELAEQGNQDAITILDRAFAYLGAGIVSLVNLFNPSKIVIGGGVSHTGDAMFRQLSAAVQEKAFEAPRSMVTIVPAQLGVNSGMLGGATLPMLRSTLFKPVSI